MSIIPHILKLSPAINLTTQAQQWIASCEGVKSQTTLIPPILITIVVIIGAIVLVARTFSFDGFDDEGEPMQTLNHAIEKSKNGAMKKKQKSVFSKLKWFLH